MIKSSKSFFSKTLLASALYVLAPLVPLGPFAVAAEGDVRFDIVRFDVIGSSLLTQEKVQSLVSPFAGSRKVYGDIQKALERLEDEYRRLGYGTVQVYVPEQELSSGVIKIQVTEAVIGKVVVSGAKFRDLSNIRNSLPQLKEGDAPNMLQLSENIQLANENPSKKLELTLGVGEDEDKVDAKLDIKDDDPEKGFVTIDNTGTKASGKHRINFSYQNANLGNNDQVLTLAYITALDQPTGVKVNIVSAGYRLPLYSLGDSMDFIYANSSTNTPANVIAPGGTLGINGKGETFAVRYNHNFARVGEYSSKLVFGLDYKYTNASCTIAGAPQPMGTVSCTPYTLRPLSATYSGNWQKPGEMIDFNVGVVHHAFPMGSSFSYGPFTNGDSGIDHYSGITGRQIKSEFSVLKYGGSYTRALSVDTLFRAAISAQYAQNPLLAGEQIGLAGSTAVRGFLERAVAMDRGYFVNLEVYSPEYAGKLSIPGSLKAVVFYDWGSGQNLKTATISRTNIASAGVGFRYSFDKDISAKLDVARVLEGHAINSDPDTGGVAAKPGDIRGHFSITYGF